MAARFDSEAEFLWILVADTRDVQGTSGSVARCVDCEFRHSLAELELDMGRDCKFIFRSLAIVKNLLTGNSERELV